jgi:THO complex subunit 3
MPVFLLCTVRTDAYYAGSGLDVTHTETGKKVYTFKTAGSNPVVAWAPTRYCLAYSDLGVLRIIGVDVDKK